MDSAFIHQAANELVQNAGTRNIKQIARSCSLDISETSRIKDMLGLLSLYFDKPLILINRQLDKQTKQMVCGYALGHYLEHQLLMDLYVAWSIRMDRTLPCFCQRSQINFLAVFFSQPCTTPEIILSGWHQFYDLHRTIPQSSSNLILSLTLISSPS